MRGLFTLITAALAAAPASPQTAPFCAERPGLANGACVVGPGAIQLETGVISWSADRHGETRSTERTIGNSTLRWGVSETDELRFEIALDNRQRGAGTDDHGLGDLSLGFKRRLTRDDAPWSLALLAAAKLPTARAPIGNRRFEGALQLSADHDLGRDWSLTLTGEADWAANEAPTRHHMAFSLASSIARGWSRRWSTAVDFLLRSDLDPIGTSNSAQAGLSTAFLATPTLQLDVEADAGITRAAPNLVLQTGFVSRF